MAATVIGLDVGTNAVRAVEVELGDSPQIRRMGQVGLPVGAVVDGEVADVGAVSIALRTLWTQSGFKSRHARVGMSSARVIVRTIEMHRLSHDELMSTIRLQLDDYVPLPAEETVFDIRTTDEQALSGQTVKLVLAATHEDAVQPLLMAMEGADLQVTAVDVIPAALALALTHPEPDQADTVDVVLSIGAGTVVVVAARDGEPLFSRTLTNACGRRTTERIASRLGVGEIDAERYKRLGATEDSTSAVALQASAESVVELTDEVRDSLAFYAEQPSSRPVRRLILTGGGSQLPGLASALADELGLDVELADPFDRVRMGDTGFEPSDLPHLAPYMAAALGIALGATRPKDRRIDLRPATKRRTHRPGTRRVLVSVGAVILVGAAGAFYMNARSAISSEQGLLAAANGQLVDLQARIAQRAPIAGQASGQAVDGTEANPTAVAASVAPTDIDWLAVEHAVEADSAPHGVIISAFQGVLEPTSATATIAGQPRPGRLTLTASAPSLPAVADWLDTVSTDPRFAEPWAAGFTMFAQPDGSTAVQFTMEMFVTDKNLVDRSSTADRQP